MGAGPNLPHCTYFCSEILTALDSCGAAGELLKMIGKKREENTEKMQGPESHRQRQIPAPQAKNPAPN
jgi:hypothetical protein